jgi:hypothetical protein
MSDIFISYSSEDRPKAALLAGKFKERGFTVWWDRNIPAGYSFTEIIGKALEDAKCIVVLWSERSVESEWVREEAQRGAKRKILVPILIDQVEPPLGFGQIEAAELWDWKGDTSNHEFIQLLHSLEAKVGRTGSHPVDSISRDPKLSPVPVPAPPNTKRKEPLAPPASPTKKTRPGSSRRTVVWLSAAAALIVIVLGVGAWRFDDLPMFIKRPLSRHIREAQLELVMLQARLRDPNASDSLQFAGFAELLGVHESHLVSDFTVPNVLFINRTADSLHKRLAAGRIANLRRAVLEDSSTTSEAMLARAQHVLTQHGGHIGAGRDFIDSLMVSLTAIVETYDSIVNSQNAIVIAEELDRWRGFQALDRMRAGAPEDDTAAARILEIVEALEGRASVTNPANITTCLSIRNRDCMGERANFDVGEVWFWARLRVPRAREIVTLEWIGPSGGIDDSYAFTVTRSNGYRVFRSRQYSEPGSYEARLYNSRRHLIGRTAFEVR